MTNLSALLMDHPFPDDQGLLYTVDRTVTAGEARAAAREAARHGRQPRGPRSQKNFPTAHPVFDRRAVIGKMFGHQVAPAALRASRSISTSAPRARPVTPMQVRAGRRFGAKQLS